MGATLADAVLQRGIDYKAIVEPRVRNLKAAYPEAITRFAVAFRKQPDQNAREEYLLSFAPYDYCKSE